MKIFIEDRNSELTVTYFKKVGQVGGASCL
jgi:hypothetical protein